MNLRISCQKMLAALFHRSSPPNPYTLSLLLITGDGRKGYPEKAPCDAIHVGAAAAVASS